MRILTVKRLREFWENHSDAEIPLKAWIKNTERARWEKSSDVVAEIPYVDPIKGDRVVFNVKGNKYRLVVKIEYSRGRVYVRFIGTHAEYDRIDAETI